MRGHPPAALRRLSVSSLYALAALLFAGCGPEDQSTPGMAPLTVQVVEAERADVPLFLDMVGSTLGTQDVPIRARVEGFLETMNFQEGGFVERGALLYTIDPQPFQAKLVEAQSRLAASQTTLAKAESDLSRIAPLAEMNAVSQQDLDSAVAQQAAAMAGVQAAEAAVQLAEIELSYTRIEAPIAGRIGLTKARPGEFVGREPNPVVLNVLSDIDPIRVRFSISERQYILLARGYAELRRKGVSRTDESEAASLQLILADGSVHPHPGRLAAMAQALDPTTGTFSMEALFPNPDGVLVPGQFARIRVQHDLVRDALVVPRRAVVELQGRFQLYTVDTSNQVVVREVKLGPINGNEQVISTGLSGGETIIVEGIQKVRPGMTVAPTPFSAVAEPSAEG
jgi:membrane fusion protein (multidrug efflux system)